MWVGRLIGILGQERVPCVQPQEPAAQGPRTKPCGSCGTRVRRPSDQSVVLDV